MPTKVNKNIHISRDNSTYKNTFTDKKGVDWVERASIPSDVNNRLMAIKEFDWIRDDNNSLERFLQLNPQFDSQFADKRKGITNRNVVNKDGSMWDLVSLKPIKSSRR